MIGMGGPTPAIRDWLAFFGGVGKRSGAIGVCREGVAIVLLCGSVVTVFYKRGAR